ncbi:histidine kinase, partial [uncultured Winogradskyella sp.]
MNKSLKKIILTIAIGSAVFVIGHLFFGGFDFKSVNDFLIDFGFYQLYAFVLGYSNMAFFDYMEKRQWKTGDTVKRIVYGIIGSTIITLSGLFLLRAFTSIVIYSLDFETFLNNESWQGYSFGLWITLSVVTVFHVIYFYNRYQKNKIKEQKVIAGAASAKFDALKNQLDPHFLFNSLNVL